MSNGFSLNFIKKIMNMGSECSLNVNGTKLNVQEGMELKSQPKEV